MVLFSALFFCFCFFKTAKTCLHILERKKAKAYRIYFFTALIVLHKIKAVSALIPDFQINFLFIFYIYFITPVLQHLRSKLKE